MFEITTTSITWRGSGETVCVQPWGDHSVRTRASMSGEVLDTDFALLPPEQASPEIEVSGAVAHLTNGRLTVRMESFGDLDHGTGDNPSRLAITYLDSDGRVLLRDAGTGGALKLRAREYRPIIGSSTYRITAMFESDPDEHLVGMGMYQQDLADLKGTTVELAHRNSQCSVPFVMSSAGYGFFWHNPAIGRATFGHNHTVWQAEASAQVDYWVSAGTPAQLSESYARATGFAPAMPERGLGFWQCKLRYWNQDQLLAVAREHVGRGLPLDVIVADFFHWPSMGDYRFEEEFWPDPAGMVAQLRDLGVELMVSIWPQVSLESENYPRLRSENLLVRAERGIDVQMTFQGPSVFLDVTNPRARATAWDIIRRNYYDAGIRTFWLDEAEPEFGVYDYDHYRMYAGSALAVGNIYPQAYARMFSEGLAEAGEGEVVNLVRAAWAGSQRYGALVWSGDVHSTWEDLSRQVAAGIHLGVAGIPWFTTDIGGFHGGDIRDPGFVELLIRWFQFGTFSPVMRLHGDRSPHEAVVAADGSTRLGSGGDNEVWSFGEEAYGILRTHLDLRERLRPYLRETMRAAHECGAPVMRGLFHEFPDDEACWGIADEFLLGADLLVAPVMAAGAREREVYLPAGARWRDIRTDRVHDGGARVLAAAPLSSAPVFARDGALADLRL